MHSDLKNIAKYYNEKQAAYLTHYGDIIQAFRPKSDKELVKYIIRSAGLTKSQQIVDAGCGYGGFTFAAAKHLNAEFIGITISEKQHQLAEEKRVVQKSQKLSFKCGDFHELTKHFKNNSIDTVLFLESLGHSPNIQLAVSQAYEILKPGGKMYIKDFYKKTSANPQKQALIDQVINNINQAYSYNVMALHQLVFHLINVGFEIDFIKTFDFEDDITIRSNFETGEGIELYPKNQEFPAANWLEIRCVKP